MGLLAEHHQLITVTLSLKLLNEGRQALSRKDFSTAIYFYQLAKKAATDLRSHDVLSVATYDLARSYRGQGSLQKAVQTYVEAKEIWGRGSTTRDKIQTAVISADLGTTYNRMGLYSKAKEVTLESLSLASTLGDSPHYHFSRLLAYSKALAYANLGNISYSEGDYRSALAYQEKAKELFGQLAKQDPKYQVDVIARLIDIAWTYKDLGDHRQSFSYVSKGIEIATELNRPDSLQHTFNLLGVLYLDQGDYASATDFLNMSLRIARDQADKYGLAGSLVNIGASNLRVGRYSEALRNYEEALSNAKSVEADYLKLVILQGLGAVYKGKGNYSRALSYFDEGLAAAAEIGDRARLAELLWSKGEVFYLQHNYADALRMGSEAHDLSMKVNAPIISYLSLTLKGRSLLAQRDFVRASMALSASIDVVEWMRGQVAGGDEQRAHFFEGTRVEPYYSMVDVLVAQNRPTQALLFAERGRARVLLDVLEQGRQRIDSYLSIEEHELLRSLKNKIFSLNSQVYAARQQTDPDKAHVTALNLLLERARLEYDSFMNRLYVAHPNVSKHKLATRPASIGELTSAVSDPKTAIVEFVVKDEQTYLFAVTWRPGGPPDTRVFPITIQRSELTDLTRKFRERLANPHLGTAKTARTLYDLLLAPARELIENRTTLIIVPDGVLWDLPFQALKAPSGRYLIEDHSVSYVPSLTVLHQMSKRTKFEQITEHTVSRRELPTLLAFGNPALSSATIKRGATSRRDERLSPLPDAETEVKALASIYPPGTSRILVGPHAREGIAKAEMAKYRVLHFATHALFDNHKPMYSHIVLSQADADKKEDGILEAWEITDFVLRAEIAVLSACETARGLIGSGEGVIGMSWAFFVAGCPTIVASQWKVDSASTSKLMIEFHRNVSSRSGPGKAVALQRAALKLLHSEKYKHPFYWAGFVLIGDGR